MKEVQDFYFKKAKKEGFPARSVYKLKEVQEKYSFLAPGQKVIDLGASPGSWTRYAAQIIGEKGHIVAVDINVMPTIPSNASFFRLNVFDMDISKFKEISPVFDVVLSDMAPKTSGVKDVDHLKSIALSKMAFHIAVRLLNRGGVFFCKVFQGRDFPGFLDDCRLHFKYVKALKPKSSRSESVEMFVLCTGFKGRYEDRSKSISDIRLQG
ncbi:MAG: RlmE family RNA methyltransferase [Dissulfurimicrobium sp.]|uniref:RlmE family RNA methyltransferase n=1 Tax=Dissulfurimicrobium sp. TaxID=2022436 RepID=UPI00404B1B0E